MKKEDYYTRITRRRSEHSGFQTIMKRVQEGYNISAFLRGVEFVGGQPGCGGVLSARWRVLPGDLTSLLSGASRSCRPITRDVHSAGASTRVYPNFSDQTGTPPQEGEEEVEEEEDEKERLGGQIEG